MENILERSHHSGFILKTFEIHRRSLKISTLRGVWRKLIPTTMFDFERFQSLGATTGNVMRTEKKNFYNLKQETHCCLWINEEIGFMICWCLVIVEVESKHLPRGCTTYSGLGPYTSSSHQKLPHGYAQSNGGNSST